MNGWIKIEDGMPSFYKRETLANDEGFYYRSDWVVVLCEDGFITTGYAYDFVYTEDDEDDHLYTSIGFGDYEGSLDARRVIAWKPLNDAYPEWFKGKYEGEQE